MTDNLNLPTFDHNCPNCKQFSVVVKDDDTLICNNCHAEFDASFLDTDELTPTRPIFTRSMLMKTLNNTPKQFKPKDRVMIIQGPHHIGQTAWVISTSEEHGTVQVSIPKTGGYSCLPEWLEKIDDKES